MTVGRRRTVGAPVVLHRDAYTRHAAFLGGTGSGEMTVALNVIEHLLLGGIPAVLIDRKGDLASYARPRPAARRPMPAGAVAAAAPA